MSRYQYEIFPTEGHVQDVIDDRSQYGWVYVRQVSRSRTVSSRSTGGGYSVGAGGFFTNHKTVYNAVYWTEVEMRRDRWDPNFQTLVECEAIADNDRWGAERPREPPTVWDAMVSVAVLSGMAGFLLAIVGAMIRPVDIWFQQQTSDMSMEGFLLGAAAVCMGIGVLAGLVWWPFLPGVRADYESQLQEYKAQADAFWQRRREAIQLARSITGQQLHQTVGHPQGS